MLKPALFSLLASNAFVFVPANLPAETVSRPNVIIIMADDMGYSDLGSYGGEIQTPNIDALAQNGLRFTNFTNAARCCPSRASMLTGQYQHRVGLQNNGSDINRNGGTIPEILKQQAGYQTAMTGKWHLTALVPLGAGANSPEHMSWLNHQSQPTRDWGTPSTYPTARGFDRFYGTIFGVVNYFDPWSLMEGGQPVLSVPEDYYVTDATTDYSVDYIREMAATEDPFFIYVSYNAPHWPLHALPEDIAKYDGVYDVGWEAIREARYQRQLDMGMFDSATAPLPPIQGAGGSWDSLSQQERTNLANLMEVHAAMIDRVDQGVGRIVDALHETETFENTLIFFLSDNGTSSERYLNPGYDRPSETREGEPIVYQKYYEEPGSETTWPYIGPRWSSAANTPFRYWKTESYRGGIQTPMIVHWPEGLQAQAGSFVRDHGHIFDILPTILDAADVAYPSQINGKSINPMDGKSLLPLLQDEAFEGHSAVFFEHENHKSVVKGKWKANQLRASNTWRLYDIEQDQTETTDLSAQHPEILDELVADWNEWYQEMLVSQLGIEVAWTGETGDFNDPANWSTQAVPTEGDHAIIANGGTAELSSGSVTVQRISPGINGTGTLKITGGELSSANMVHVGHILGNETTGVTADGTLGVSGSGAFNLADGLRIGSEGGATGKLILEDSGTVTLTANGFIMGFRGHGTGELHDNAALNQAGPANVIIGDIDGSASFHQTGGSITVANGQFWVGQNTNGVGSFTLDAGSISVNNEFVVGRAAGKGTFAMNGGTITKTGGGHFLVGFLPGGNGSFIQTGGTINIDNGEFWTGNGDATGSYTLSNGTINVNNWISVGRDRGNGTFTMTGGSINKTGPGNMTIAGYGSGVRGLFTQSGGEVNLNGARLQIANNDNANGTFTLSGDAVFRAGTVVLNIASGNAQGTMNLNGGTLTTGHITGNLNSIPQPGTSRIDFNGTLIRATASHANFIEHIAQPNILEDGLRLDTDGHSLTINTDFPGTGGITKLGTGTLNLTGTNTFTGDSAVLGGTLNIDGNQSAATGTITVQEGATLGGSGTLGGPVIIEPQASLVPTSDLTVAAATIQGSLNLTVSGTSSTRLTTLSALDLTGGTLTVTANGTAPTEAAYILATYAARTGDFANVNIPSGYHLDYAFEGNQIALVAGEPPLDGYETWAVGHGLDLNGSGAKFADANGDGISNFIAYALGLDPVNFTKMPAAVIDNGYLQLDYTRYLPAKPHADVTAKKTDKLGLSWTTEGIEDVSLGTEGELELRRARTPATGSRTFLRLEVSEIPD